MQAPPYQQPVQSPPRRGTPWGKILGCSCAGCAVLGLLIGGIFFFVFYSAFAGTPLTPTQLAYAGSWAGADGSTFTIRPDGHGDLRSGGATATNGGVKIDDAAKTLRIGFKTFHIDEPPQEASGGTEMKLDGITFRRTGSGGTFGGEGGSSSSSGSSGGDIGGSSGGTGSTGATAGQSSPTGVPSRDELARLATSTLVDLNEALKTGDFSTLHAKCASQFKAKYLTPADMKAAFQPLIDKSASFGGVASVAPVFETEPAIDSSGVLSLSGYYPTQPARTHFELKYVNQESEWKPIGINVSLTQ